MPAKVKEMAEATEKASPEQAIEKQPERPEKAAGPMSLLRAASAPQPPPTAKPSDADTLNDVELNPGAPGRARSMTALQKSVGNTRLSRMLGSTVQARLAISSPDDIYEKEADQVAETIASGQKTPQKAARISRLPVTGLAAPTNRNEPITRKESNGVLQTASNGAAHGEAVDANMQARIESPGGGRALPEGMRREMESGLGADFSDVRVHDNAQDQADAQGLNAKAFTHGNHIWLGSGASANDRKLMAHELTHVVQQTGSVQRKPAATSDQQPDSTPAPSSDRSEQIPDEPLPSQEPVEEETYAEELPENSEDTQAQPAEPPDENQGQFDGDVTADTTPAGSPDEGDGASANSMPAASADTSTLESPEPPDPAGDMTGPATESIRERETEQPDAAQVTGHNAAPGASHTIAEPETPASQPATNLIQRDEDEGGGLLDRIRSRISGIVDGLRSGWTRLGQMAQGAFEGISGQVGGMVGGLRSLVSSAISGIQGAWSGLARRATQLTDGIKRQFQSAVNTVTGATQAIAQAIMRLDADALRAAWGRLTGLIGAVWQRLQQAGQTAFRLVTGLWQGLRTRFTGVLSNLANRARDLFNRLRAAAEGIRQRLASAWDALRNRASQMSGVLGGILDALRSVVSRLISWGQQIWNGIQEQWSALRGRISSLLQQVQQRVTSVWQGLRQRAMSMWSRLQGLWSRLRQWVRQQAQRLIRGFGSMWDGIRRFSIGQIIDSILRFAPFLRAAYEVAQDPMSVLRPVAEGIAAKIEAGMPAAAEQQAREHTGGKSGGAPSAAKSATGGTVVQRTVGNLVVQRQPLNQPLGWDQGALWGGFWDVLVEKWNQFWDHPVDNILKILRDMFFFWETVPRDFRGLISDLERVIGRMTAAGLGFWRHLIDIPLIIWRRVNAILFDLYPLFVLLSVALGAIAGGLLGTAGAAILTFMVGGAGAPVGAGVGFAAGAGIGLGFAFGVGEGLLASYVAAELLSMVKAWADLTFVEQTEDEQAEDLDQMVSSAIGLAIAAILFGLSAVAGAFARGLKLRLRPGGAAQRFIQGFQRGFRGGSPFRRGRGTGPRLTIRERLQTFYDRLRAVRAATSAEEALQQIRSILNQVEDEFSGVVRQDPPPPPNQPDGRMYPPLDDFVTRNLDGSISARTRGHRIEIGADGSIKIHGIQSGQIEFSKPGGN